MKIGRILSAVSRAVLVAALIHLWAWGGLPESGKHLVEVWDSDSGLPHSTVTSIAQTPDGKPGTPRTWVHVQHMKNRHIWDREFILNNANELRHVVETGASEFNPIQSKSANEVEQAARQSVQAVFDELGK